MTDKTYIEKDGLRLMFGGESVLSNLVVEPLKYRGEYPFRDSARKEVLPRKIKLEGYLTSRAEDACGIKNGVAHRRSILGKITSPGTSFTFGCGGKTAVCSDGELSIYREAPFSGESAEHFILTATVAGGFFTGPERCVAVTPVPTGTAMPSYVTGNITVGVYDGETAVRVENYGDVPTGFTAELHPADTVTYIKITNSATGEVLHLKRSFAKGDTVRICTVPGEAGLSLIRGGKEYNLSGYASDDSVLLLLSTGENILCVEGGAIGGHVSFCEKYVTL